MANSVDISKVYLMCVPLENDYKHTLYFANASAQHTYFQSKVMKSYTNFTYVRKDNLIYVPEHYDDIHYVNYVMYQNSKYDNKWFYAFVKNLKYENDECTILEIETDVIQTWMFDYVINPSFVEREHVIDDMMGSNTVPEGLETGDYIVNIHQQAQYGGVDLPEGSVDVGNLNVSIVIGVTVDSSGNDFNGGMYHGLYSGIKYYSFPCTFEGVTKIKNFINAYDEEARGSAITCMFLAPLLLAPIKEGNAITQTNTIQQSWINHGDISLDNVKHMSFTDELLDSYEPRNNKLKCFPYRYLLVSNNCGSDVIYNYEDFYTKEFDDDLEDDVKTITGASFEIQGCLTPSCSVRMLPLNYKGDERNDSEGINLGKYPILNWTSDVFTNWLTQNGVNTGLTITSSLVSILAGGAMLATGAGAIAGGTMIAGGVVGIGSSVAEVRKHSLIPPQSQGNINCGDIITTANANDFHFYDMSIKSEYAKIIDKYFDMFGYKVNMVKVPNKDHREKWWFTKTIDINIDGSLPQDDMQKIKDAYNNGITFWRNANEINNYNLINTPILEI